MKKTQKNKILATTKKRLKQKLGPKKFEVLKKISLFILGGILLLTTKIILTYTLVDILRINLKISYLITIITAMIIGFLYSYYVTFKNKTEPLKKLAKYIISIGIFYLADYTIVISLTNLAGIYHITAIILTTMTIFLLKYITYDKLIFKEKSLH